MDWIYENTVLEKGKNTNTAPTDVNSSYEYCSQPFHGSLLKAGKGVMHS